MCFANAGIPVTIVETSREALDRGLATVSKNYKNTVKRGGLKADDMERRVRLMNGTTDIEAVRDADIVIEAVFEEMDLKKQVFAKLDKLAKPTAVLATNTSYLNVNEIAKATERPPSVLGMHFFSPANVMRLLEIVRGAATAPDVLATAIAVGRKIGKVPAVVGVCHGFVGNRMLHTRGIEAERMLLEGALPQDVDGALTEFGFPMGPFAMGDLAGLDVGWRVRKASGAKAEIADALVDAGRYGQKTGRGFYRYEGGSRSPLPDPDVEKLIVEASVRHGIKRRNLDRKEIFERLIFPMINEGARILDEGIAMRPGDIDVIWVYGYGWPVWTGGPMHYADRVGLPYIRERIRRDRRPRRQPEARTRAAARKARPEGRHLRVLQEDGLRRGRLKEVRMPEAVIVSTARTPIGKAYRGAFNTTQRRRARRPRDQGGGHARRHRAGRGRGRDPRLRHARARHGPEHRAPFRGARRPAGHGLGRHRQPLLQLGPAGDRHGGAPRHAGRDQGDGGRRA